MSRPAHLNIAPNTALPPGAELSRKEWVSLNRLRTGVGCFGVFMYRWGLRQSTACQCGAPEQTAQHLMDECPNFCPPVDLNLCNPGPSTREWLVMATGGYYIMLSHTRRRRRRRRRRELAQLLKRYNYRCHYRQGSVTSV